MRLFCFVCLLHWNLLDCASPSRVFSIIRKPLARRGARALFQGVETYGMKFMDFLGIF